MEELIDIARLDGLLSGVQMEPGAGNAPVLVSEPGTTLKDNVLNSNGERATKCLKLHCPSMPMKTDFYLNFDWVTKSSFGLDAILIMLRA